MRMDGWESTGEVIEEGISGGYVKDSIDNYEIRKPFWEVFVRTDSKNGKQLKAAIKFFTSQFSFNRNVNELLQKKIQEKYGDFIFYEIDIDNNTGEYSDENLIVNQYITKEELKNLIDNAIGYYRKKELENNTLQEIFFPDRLKNECSFFTTNDVSVFECIYVFVGEKRLIYTKIGKNYIVGNEIITFNELIKKIEKMGTVHDYKKLKNFIEKNTPQNNITKEEILEELALHYDDYDCRFNKKGYFNVVDTYLKISYSFNFKEKQFYIYDFKNKTTKKTEGIPKLIYYIFLNKEWFKK